MGVTGVLMFFFSSRRRHTRYWRDWSSDVCSSDIRDPWDIEGALEENYSLPHAALAALDGALHDLAAKRLGIPVYKLLGLGYPERSEERRVGKEWRSRWSPYH